MQVNKYEVKETRIGRCASARLVRVPIGSDPWDEVDGGNGAKERGRTLLVRRMTRGERVGSGNVGGGGLSYDPVDGEEE
jgi:hypothetical protein